MLAIIFNHTVALLKSQDVVSSGWITDTDILQPFHKFPNNKNSPLKKQIKNP